MKSDREKILKFIHDLYYWLDISLTHQKAKHKWPIIYVRDDLLDKSKAAWFEFRQDYSIEMFVRSVSHFSKNRLVKHGLYGAQLDYKLKTVEVVVEEGKQKTKGWKRKLLDILDNLLESIGSGLPGYGALKELKDTLLLGVDPE